MLVAQRSENTCPLGKVQYFGMAKGDYLRDTTRKAVEAQISASLLSQTWTLSFPVNLMETIKAYCDDIYRLEN